MYMFLIFISDVSVFQVVELSTKMYALFWSLIGFSAHHFVYKVLCVAAAPASGLVHPAHVCVFFVCWNLFVCSLTAHVRGVVGLMCFFFGSVCF